MPGMQHRHGYLLSSFCQYILIIKVTKKKKKVSALIHKNLYFFLSVPINIQEIYVFLS